MFEDFNSQIRDLLSRDEVIRLAYYPGHRVSHRFPKDKSSMVHSRKRRLNHSLRVSYISYTLARFFRINRRNTARAGLLHDSGFNPDSAEHSMTQVVKHASRGAEIARNRGEPQEIVNAISSHMFPLNPRTPPSSGLSLILWFADKIDSFLEYLGLSIILDKRINESINLKSRAQVK
jgi:putative nucleotidyltransferase with HDIG domain